MMFIFSLLLLECPVSTILLSMVAMFLLRFTARLPRQYYVRHTLMSVIGPSISLKTNVSRDESPACSLVPGHHLAGDVDSVLTPHILIHIVLLAVLKVLLFASLYVCLSDWCLIFDSIMFFFIHFSSESVGVFFSRASPSCHHGWIPAGSVQVVR